MPYKNVNDLPDSVRNSLPLHAQEIYRAAFNNAYEEYKDPEKRRNPGEDLEQVCHKIAWSAVEQKYTKNKDGEWVEK